MDKVIPLKLVYSAQRQLNTKGLLKDEEETIEQLLQVLRRGTSEQKKVIRQTILVHFNTLSGEISAK